MAEDETTRLKVEAAQSHAAGLPAVFHSLQHVWSKAGVVRGTRALALLNQQQGIDCPSCAWPDPDRDRSFTEFCENGAKAIAWEADRRTIGRDFFARWSIPQLARQSDHWHGQQGRLIEPMIVREGREHYEPITWDEAFRVIAGELNRLESPDEAAFYTSGRTSNEAAFLYQLFVREYGTNNLPDCSNMCHESSGAALIPTIGIGKGTVTLDDFEKAQVILILGQNPGTNHPRMLTTLQKAKRAGAKIIAVNPIKEAGLLAFRNPQEVSQLLGLSQTTLADHYVQVRIGGDQAFLKGILKALLHRNALDAEFIAKKTDGLEALQESLHQTDWEAIERQSGVTREEIETVAEILGSHDRLIVCWAMGLTQHRHAVATIQEVVNLVLMRGSIGKPGAGLCPVRGHSNVQGNRTMGIVETPGEAFLNALQAEFGFSPPQKPGFNTVETIRAMLEQRVKVFFALGGNFLSASPDTDVTARALQNCRLTVQVSIKLNRSHLVPGKIGLILPCLGRTDRDRVDGREQFVTTENSMGVVQRSQGTLEPCSSQLLSEPVLVACLARAVLGNKSRVPWENLISDYDLIRDRIERVVPGFQNYNQRVRKPSGFYLPNRPREGEFPTDTGKAKFTVHPLHELSVAPGELVMMTIRSHDQFNTTIYGLDDRYRGIHNGRRVILMNRSDIADRQLQVGENVSLISHFQGQTRRAESFTVVEYEIPRGCSATYFPEANVLVPLESTAEKSHTPTSKWVAITIEKLSG